MRMINRHKVGLGLEVVHGVPAFAHDSSDESIRLVDHGLWLINEACLQLVPALAVTLPGTLRERPDLETISVLEALAELTLRLSTAAALNGTVVFRSEALPQHPTSAPPLHSQHRDREPDQDNGEDDKNPSPCLQRNHPSSHAQVETPIALPTTVRCGNAPRHKSPSPLPGQPLIEDAHAPWTDQQSNDDERDAPQELAAHDCHNASHDQHNSDKPKNESHFNRPL
jgi:hypothetical protein